MFHFSSAVTVEPPYEPTPVRTARWTLTGARPGRLAFRLVLAAAAVGIVGGAITGLLVLIFGNADGSAAARLVTMWLPIGLFAMIVWWLAANLADTDRGPSRTGIALTTSWLLVLGALLVGVPMLGAFTTDFPHNAAVALGGAFVGAEIGLLFAAVAVVALIPAILLACAVGVQVSVAGAQMLLTVFVMAVAGLLSLAPSDDLTIPVPLAMALTGVGAVLTSSWALMDRVRVNRTA